MIVYLHFQIENQTSENDLPQHFLKQYGHNIEELFGRCEYIFECYGFNKELKKIKNDTVVMAIVKHLSDFAKGDRYYYLDEISSMQSTLKQDPLENWKENVEDLIFNKYKDKILSAYSLYVKEMDCPIFPCKENDFDLECFKITYLQDYSVESIYKFIFLLVKVFSKQISLLPQFAFVDEFFTVFLY